MLLKKPYIAGETSEAPSNVTTVLAIVLSLALSIVLLIVFAWILYREYYFKTRMNEDTEAIEMKEVSSANQGLDRANVNNG